MLVGATGGSSGAARRAASVMMRASGCIAKITPQITKIAATTRCKTEPIRVMQANARRPAAVSRRPQSGCQASDPWAVSVVAPFR